MNSTAGSIRAKFRAPVWKILLKVEKTQKHLFKNEKSTQLDFLI